MRKIDTKKITPLFFAISTLIIMFAPYQPDSTLGNSAMRSFFRVLIYLFAFANIVFVISDLLRKNKLNIKDVLAAGAYLTFFFLTVFHTYNGSLNFSGFLSLILCITFYFSSNECKSETFKIIYKVWVVISILSIICYISYVLNLFIPYQEVNYYVTYHHEKYINYGLVFLHKEEAFLRLCGICNEPGYFGTFSAFFLCANGMNLKDKKNLIIFIAGLLTFSVAYVVILAIYLLCKSWKNIKVFLLVFILLISYIFVLPNIKTNNENINRLLERLTITDEGLKGDNRSNDKLDSLFIKTIKEKPIFGQGYGYINSLNIGAIGSYKEVIVEYGLIGAFISWCLLFFVALRKDKNVIYFVIIYFISIYQRPSIMSLPYQVMLLGGVLYILSKSQKEVKELTYEK